jgi:hypothetical protein
MKRCASCGSRLRRFAIPKCRGSLLLAFLEALKVARAAGLPEKNIFAVEVYLGEMKPDLVRVELYADPSGDRNAERAAMRLGRPIEGAINAYFFEAETSGARPADLYTPRIIPYHPEAQVPLEDIHILWQR